LALSLENRQIKEFKVATAGDNQLRQELGDFSSIVCLKAIVVGVEEALGEKAAAIALIAAGRQRGKHLAEQLGLVNKGGELSLEAIRDQVNQAIGKDGTRLCIIDKLEQDKDVYKVYARETVCLAGEPDGSSRHCTYTLGAIQGLLESILNQRLRGRQTESVTQGGTHELLEYSNLA
jgi:predicted hydrocarbon binding protein